MKRICMSLIALAGLLAACGKPVEPAAPAPEGALAAGPGPALWRTGDADTTIYLFGTVHVLPPALDWRRAAIDTALNEAQAVYFETDINPDMLSLQGLVTDLGMYKAPDRLSNHLDADDYATLSKISAELDLPVYVLDSLKPWFAAMTLSEQLITKAGFDPMSGVERTLGPVAAQAGKDIRKFETIEFQLRVFADLPEPVQVRYLMEGVHQIDEEMKLLDDLIAAWARGDVDALDQIMIEDELAGMPEVYNALLVNRNRNWAETLRTLSEAEPGVFFVAVGAAHLAGKDSLQTMLQADGMAVERVN